MSKSEMQIDEVHENGYVNMVKKVVNAIDDDKYHVLKWESHDNYFLETWENDQRAHNFTNKEYLSLTSHNIEKYNGKAISVLKSCYHQGDGELNRDGIHATFFNSLDQALDNFSMRQLGEQIEQN